MRNLDPPPLPPKGSNQWATVLVDWLISRLHFALGNAQDGKCDMVSFDATLH